MSKKSHVLSDFIPFLKKRKETDFRTNGNLTLGAEIELQIIDSKSLELSCKSQEIIDNCSNSYKKKIKQEIFLNMIEINSAKCQNTHEIEKDLSDSINYLENISQKLELSFASNASHPFTSYKNATLTKGKRYQESIEDNQWLAKRNNIFGLHIHLGMKNSEDVIRFNNFFLNFVPHFIALSASSPFWCSNNTGLNSMRPTTYESHPSCGHPFSFNSWSEFEKLYNALIKSGSIKTIRDLWWDIRPSPQYGTLEIRVCDGTATLAETTAIVAFVHLLANWFEENAKWLEKVPAPTMWVARQNKWRALRYGLDAEIIVNNEGETRPIRQDLLQWIEDLKPFEKKLSYQNYVNTLENLIQNGNSATRQIEIYNKTNSLTKVVQHNIEEFNNRQPIWQNRSNKLKKLA